MVCGEGTFTTMITLILTAAIITVIDAIAIKDVTDDQYLMFPRLYHLDDYEDCLLRKDGVFCLGTFHITPRQGHHPTYTLMKRYSDNTFTLNRTRLHRGYCLTTRCASLHATGPPMRFEKCAAKWGARRGLNLQLQSLVYCHNHQQFLEKLQRKLEGRHRMLLAFVAVVVGFNVLGTLYDVIGGKWKPLVAWSTRTNFIRLFKPHGDEDGPRSTLTLEGGKVLLMWLVIIINAGVTHNKLYLQNPKFIEQVYRHPILQYVLNINLAVQIVIMISSFLLAENIMSQRRRPTFRFLTKLLLRQIFRIYPVHLFSIWYASTWWPLARGGPQWHHVESEAEVCREKFWSMTFFVDNFADDNQQCLQTWFISIFIQLYIVGSFLMLLLLRTRRPLTILVSLLVASCVVNAVVAYTRDWKPLAMIGGPENMSTTHSQERTRREWDTKPWGSLTAALTGLTLAFLHKQFMYKKYNTTKYKWLSPASQLAFPAMLVWAGVGRMFGSKLGRAARALCFALDAPVLCFTVALFMIQVYNKPQKKTSVSQQQGFLGRFFTWWMWFPLARVSLSTLILHRVINSIIAFSRPTLYNACLLDWMVDFVGTASYTYLAAASVTLLLDMPLQRLLD